jgi:hypothetical protein
MEILYFSCPSLSLLFYTEKYDAHNDYFDPFLYQSSPDVLRSIRNGEQNRHATVFWYLTTVKEGGETYFPR